MHLVIVKRALISRSANQNNKRGLILDGEEIFGEDMNLSPFADFNVPWPSKRLCKKAPSYLEATKTKWKWGKWVYSDRFRTFKESTVLYQLSACPDRGTRHLRYLHETLHKFHDADVSWRGQMT